MSTIDIRATTVDPTRIVIADQCMGYYRADILEKKSNGFEVKDTESGRFLQVLDRQTAEHLIKGLQKAIELGWV